MWRLLVLLFLHMICSHSGDISRSKVFNNHFEAKSPACDVGPCAQALSDLSAFPGERQYTEGTLMYNPLYSQIKPAFVTFPKSIEDLQRCLKCAYQHLVPFTVKSGGHSGEGYSTIDGSNNGAFVINLSEMKQVDVDEELDIARVQAGARWQDVYNKVNDSKYIIIGGLCPTVGVSGFTLGGGYSFLSRYFGLTIDNTLSFTMITANGSSVVVANASTHTDLYWALRGGGGGNFGVVVDYTFRIHPVVNPQTRFVYATMVHNSSSAKIIEGFFDSISDVRQFYVYVALLPGGKIQLYLLFLEKERHFSDFSHLIQTLLNMSLNYSIKYYASYLELYKDVGNQLHIRTATAPHAQIIKGCILNQIPLMKITGDREINAIPENCTIIFNHLGGAISDIAPTDTAYYHRNGRFESYVPCFFQNENEKSTALEFEQKLFQELKVSGYCIGNYVNDIDKELKDWQEGYYGGNYGRLVEVNKKWNPLDKGMFHFLQEIGSDYNP